GTVKGVPPARTSRRCSSNDAATHMRYNDSAATFARIASWVKLLLMASAPTITACAAIAMCGVRNFGWTRASTAGNMPSRANANIKTMAVRPTSDAAGNAGHARYTPRTNQTPATTKTTSGISFAAVIASTSLAPTDTPRTLITARIEKRRASSSARPMPDPAAGQSTPIDPAKALATDATANAAITHDSTPARNPTNRPNATSTYAYSPPVSDTRLPAEAKHNTMSAINMAQTR